MELQADIPWLKANAPNANSIYTFFTGVLACAAYTITKIGPTEVVLG